jgi:hypothetical protein
MHGLPLKLKLFEGWLALIPIEKKKKKKLQRERNPQTYFTFDVSALNKVYKQAFIL